MSFDFGKWGTASSDGKLQIKARNPPEFLMEFKAEIAALSPELAELVSTAATSGKAQKIKGDKDALIQFLRNIERKSQAAAPAPAVKKEEGRKEGAKKEGAKKEERRESGSKEAEGLKFGVEVKESASEVLLRDGKQEEGSVKVAGEIAINNPSEKNDIWDVEVAVADKDKTGLESDKVKTLRVPAKESFKQEYPITAEVKEMPLTVKEIASTLGDVKHEAYYVRPGKEPTVAFKISVKNGSDKAAKNVTVTKEFHANFENLKATRPSQGKADFEGQKLTWTIESLEAGAEAEAEVQGLLKSKESQEPVPSGDVILAYVLDGTFTGLKVPSAVATTSGVGGLSFAEMDETPDNYTIKGFVKNTSDFAVQLGEFSAYTLSQKDKPDTTLPEGKEVMLGPDQTWESEAWNKEFKEGLPSLAHSWRIRAVPAITVASSITSTLKSFNFGVSDISAAVTYNVDKLASLRNTPFLSTLSAENTASAPLDTVILEEKIQKGFIPPLPRQVEAMWNGEKLTPEAFVVEILDDEGKVIASSAGEAAAGEAEAEEVAEEVAAEAGKSTEEVAGIEPGEKKAFKKLEKAAAKGTRVRVKLANIHETPREAFKNKDKIEAKYPIISHRVTAGEIYKADATMFANTYPAGELAEFRPEILPTIGVAKLIRGYRHGKDIMASGTTSGYSVKLWVENNGVTPLTNVHLHDAIPEHFTITEVPQGAEVVEEGGQKLIKAVKDVIQPKESFEITYELVGDGEHSAKQHQIHHAPK